MTLEFHPLTLADRENYQSVSLKAGRRNCNYTFANLVGWQFWFNTELCMHDGSAVLRFTVDGRRAYMICSDCLNAPLLEDLMADAGADLTIVGLEDDCVRNLSVLGSRFLVETEPRRNQYDYIYRRADLAALQGGKLKAKRNHVNKFRSEHPGADYRPLEPSMFDECRRLVALWQEEKPVSEDEVPTILAEQRVMETVSAHWDALGMLGGSIWLDGRLVAFTYGAAVTDDTLDVCVEKADRSIDGLFSAINQQFCLHLPEQYVYINREEDMGLVGLRKAKLSYHPEILLSYNVVHIK